MGRRNRAWEAREILGAFTDLERGLASPTGDTRSVGRPGKFRRDVRSEAELLPGTGQFAVGEVELESR